MPRQPKRGVAAAFWRSRWLRKLKPVPTLKELFEAKCRARAVPGVRSTRRGATITEKGGWECGCAPNTGFVAPSCRAGAEAAATTGICESRAPSRKNATSLTAKQMMHKTNSIENMATMAIPIQIDKPFSQESHETQNSGKHEHDEEFACTACGRSVALVEVRAHPTLHVGICKHCYDFQVSNPFTKDNPQNPFWHENECRWCGDSDDVILCDSCPKVFCKFCIKRNFGEEILNAIESPPRDWSCFVCNNEHLQILNRDHVQATLIGDLLQTLVQDYTNVENLVKTMKRSSQTQKSKTSKIIDLMALENF